MLTYTYISPGKFELIDKPKPELQGPRDAIVRITLGSICTSDLHIKHGSVPRAVPGITVGHEMDKLSETLSGTSFSLNGWESEEGEADASTESATATDSSVSVSSTPNI